MTQVKSLAQHDRQKDIWPQYSYIILIYSTGHSCQENEPNPNMPKIHRIVLNEKYVIKCTVTKNKCTRVMV